jgi:hypothetical protein
MAQQLELGMISSTWIGTKVGLEEGIRAAKEIGFDTYDVFEDPLDIDDDTRRLIKETADGVGLPIRSLVCVAFGIVDFNPSVRRFTLDRIKAYVDQGAYLGARNVLLVVGEYFWDGEVFPNAAIWDMSKEMVKGEYTEVQLPDRLTFTWQWEHEPDVRPTTVRATFSEKSQDSTEVLLEHLDFHDLEEAQNHEVGWNITLDRLAQVVASRMAASAELP